MAWPERTTEMSPATLRARVGDAVLCGQRALAAAEIARLVVHVIRVYQSQQQRIPFVRIAAGRTDRTNCALLRNSRLGLSGSETMAISSVWAFSISTSWVDVAQTTSMSTCGLTVGKSAQQRRQEGISVILRQTDPDFSRQAFAAKHAHRFVMHAQNLLRVFVQPFP